MKFKQWVQIQKEAFEAVYIIAKINHTDPLRVLGEQEYIPGYTCNSYMVNVYNLAMRKLGYSDYIPALHVNKWKGNIFYFCNEEFMKIPTRYRSALIEHEIGHIVLGHLNNKAKMIFQNLFRSVYEPKTEYDADDYAVSMVGLVEYRGALEYLYERYKDAGYPTKGLKLRIEKLLLKG